MDKISDPIINLNDDKIELGLVINSRRQSAPVTGTIFIGG